MDHPVEVSICICTCRRPEMLDRLLYVLSEQSLPDAEIIVVDNDPLHGARDTLLAWGRRLPLRFAHQPVPNIAATRNTAVGLARGQWIAFVDDDEIPVDSWVHILLETQQKYAADVIMAPVLPSYPEHVATWLRAGGFFERPRFRTGEAITDKDARTGNTLIRAALIKTLPGPFDTDFGQSGGEDTILFRQLYRSGARFVWCDEASVTEEVPAERACADWLLRRSYRIGQTSIQVELYQRSPGEALLIGMRLGGRALLQLLLALIFSIVFSLFDPLRAFRWLRTAVAQLGKLTALIGLRYLEYAR